MLKLINRGRVARLGGRNTCMIVELSGIFKQLREGHAAGGLESTVSSWTEN